LAQGSTLYALASNLLWTGCAGLPSVAFQPEADLQGDLEVGHLAVHDVATSFDDLEPVDVPDRLGGGCDGVADGVIGSCAGRIVISYDIRTDQSNCNTLKNIEM
jgi:hypothetical protein